jgi:hypothetical protein
MFIPPGQPGGVQPETIGVYRPGTSSFLLRGSNSSGPADLSIMLGQPGDQPVVGDWTGRGVDALGLFRSGRFFLADANTNDVSFTYTFAFGTVGDIPLAGDWAGRGHDGVGVYRPLTGMFYLKNDLTGGAADFTVILGQPGDLPVVGDWIGQGHDSVGVYRPSTGMFYLTNQLCKYCAATVDLTVSLDGLSGGVPVMGDWTGLGRTGLGVFHAGMFALRNDATTSGPADVTVAFGAPGDVPLAGAWSLSSGQATVVPGPTAIPEPPNQAAPTFIPSRN